jgi:transposase
VVFTVPDQEVIMTVMIGIDPHKRSHTAVAIDERGKTLDELRVTADRRQVATLLAWANRFGDRRWAVEGAGGLGRLLAVGLVSAGEQVVDVPATLSARVRTLGGTPHKTDGHDARSTALAGRHRDDLRLVRLDDLTVQIGLLLTRRWQLVSTRQKMLCWVHDQFLQLIPGGAEKMLSPDKIARILRTIPTCSGDPVVDQRRQIVVDLLGDLRRHHTAIKQVERQLDAALAAHGTTLTGIVGIGRVGAATLIATVGDPTRFATHGKFASFAGVAPLEVSSGDRQRHRVNRGGQRQVNKILHTAAMQQVCRDTEGRTYYRRKRDQGMTHMEALRCLKRQIAKAVWRTMIADADKGVGPGGTIGNVSTA